LTTSSFFTSFFSKMENTIDPVQLTPTEAVAHIMRQVGDPTKFRNRHRGFVDWKFGELAEYRGYQGALDYVATMRRWYNYATAYKGQCLLDESFELFQESLQKLNLSPAPSQVG
jgi:hypothetical protein